MIAVNKVHLVEEAIDDLDDTGIERIGTCPCCHTHRSFHMRRTEDGYDVFCDCGCVENEIKDGVRRVLAVTNKNGYHGKGSSGEPLSPVAAPRSASISGYNAVDLMQVELAPARYAVPGYVCEGLNIFAGGQKFGKSWMFSSAGSAIT